MWPKSAFTASSLLFALLFPNIQKYLKICDTYTFFLLFCTRNFQVKMCKIPDFLKELSRKFCYILYTSICWRLKIAIFQIVKILPPYPQKQNYTGG